MPRKYRLDRLEVPELEETEPKIRRKVMREAVKVVAVHVRATAPDSGKAHPKKLRKMIRYQLKQAGLTGVVAAKAPHAHLVHDGTKPHTISARPPGIMVWNAGGETRIARTVQHPGAKANPFLVRAGEDTRDDVERILREGAEAALAEVAG